MKEAGRRSFPRADGEITVFLSLSIMCIAALLLVLAESARCAGERWYLKTAADSAIDSVFSMYHRQLWDSYRLLFAEYDNDEEIASDYEAELAKYFQTAGWYSFTASDIDINSRKMALDDAGTYFEKEISDYMKYGIWNTAFGTSDEQSLLDAETESLAAEAVDAEYDDRSEDVRAIEKAYENIIYNLKEQSSLRTAAINRLSDWDGPGFRKKAEDIKKLLAKVPALVAAYDKEADALKKKLEESRSLYDAKKTDLSDVSQEKFDSEIRIYSDYVDEDGQRRSQTDALKPLSYEQTDIVQRSIEEALEAEEEIDEADDDDEDGPDEGKLWRSVKRTFSEYTVANMEFAREKADTQKENWLRQAKSLFGGDLLALVLPEGTEVSAGSIDTSGLPSADASFSEAKRSVALKDRLLINEYTGKFFRCFRTGMTAAAESGMSSQTDPIPHTGDDGGSAEEPVGIDGDGGLSYEVEYLVCGEKMDEENLSGVVTRLVAMREGLNFIYLLQDEEKKNEARVLAAAVTGITGTAPLVGVVQYAILSIWALGESVNDVKSLFDGGKVPLFKSGSDWKTGLDDILNAGKNGKAAYAQSENGLSYMSWLKLLLYMGDTVTQEARMMDMIEMNICRGQPSFKMKRGMYELHLTVTGTAEHLFFSPGLVQCFLGSRDHSYRVGTTCERSY